MGRSRCNELVVSELCLAMRLLASLVLLFLALIHGRVDAAVARSEGEQEAVSLQTVTWVLELTSAPSNLTLQVDALYSRSPRSPADPAMPRPARSELGRSVRHTARAVGRQASSCRGSSAAAVRPEVPRRFMLLGLDLVHRPQPASLRAALRDAHSKAGCRGDTTVLRAFVLL